jgi:RIO-like serine/threonine protein kinase
MNDLKKTIHHLRLQYQSGDFASGRLRLLHIGRYGNAHVYRYRDKRRDLVVKDFSHCPWWFRLTLGRFYVRRECLMLRLLQGVRGVAGEVRRLGPFSLAYEFVEGQSLAGLADENARLPPEFFGRWYALVMAMHARGVVHLDMRNLGNILLGADGYPHVIDFQSALRLRSLPKFARRLLTDTDVSSIVKGWLRLCPEPLAPKWVEFYRRFMRWRKLWIFKGYPLRGLFKNKKRQPAGEDASAPHKPLNRETPKKTRELEMAATGKMTKDE